MDGIIKLKTKQILAGCALALSTTLSYSGTMGPASIDPTGTIYAGVFGGGGALSSTDIHQFGTAFFFEGVGGPLAVNGFGVSENTSVGMVGAHVGFAWPNQLGIYLPVTPAFELEGYYLGEANIVSHELDNVTLRLNHHDFLVNYPMEAGVFLVNGILNANRSFFDRLRPYVGFGIGSAVLSISDASAFQINPSEPGINHYSHTEDKSFGFAAQPKIGLRYDLTPNTNIFVEYRYLYISETKFTFGSTVASGHVATSPWLVNIKPQSYNMGTIGINFDV